MLATESASGPFDKFAYYPAGVHRRNSPTADYVFS